MASVVADTDLVIDFLRGKGPGVEIVRDLITSSRLRLTAITAFELRVGTDFHNRAEDIARLLRTRTLSMDLESAIRAGQIASDLRSAGEPIGFAVCIQAGVCLRHGLPFATRNLKHFRRVEGLDLVEIVG